MAGNSDIIKEYLVALGFKVDQSSYKKFDAALSQSGKAAFAFAGAIAALTAGTVAFVDKVSSKLDDLYWSSVRLNEGAADIQDFALSISKLGGTADGALASLENLSQHLKTDPGAEAYLNNFGVATRDANGELRKTSDIIKDIARLPQPLFLRTQIAAHMGVDYATLMGSIRAETLKTEDTVSGMWRRAGLSADKATEASHNFQNELKDQEARWGVVADVIAYRLLPVAEAILDWASRIADAFVTLDRVTGGLSTVFFVLAAAILAVNAALKVTTGLGVVAVLRDLALEAAVLADAVLPALGEAIFAVGGAIEATPLGWIVTIIAAIGAGIYLLITHWGDLKQAFQSSPELKDIAEDLGDIFDAVMEVVGAFGDIFKAFWDVVGHRVVLIFLTTIRDDLLAIADAAAAAADALTGKFGRAWEHVTKLGHDLTRNPYSEADQLLADSRKGGSGATDGAGGADQGYRSPEAGVGPWSLYGSPSGAGGASAPASQVAKALAFFQKAGWTAAQAAGIVANLVAESGLQAHGPAGDGGAAVGVAQWHPDRQADFKKWSGGTDVQHASLEQQLAFLNYEMTQGSRATKGFVSNMQAAANSAAMAAVVVSKYVESPDDQTGVKAAQRAGIAQSLLANSKVAPGNAGGASIKVDQKTEINVHGSGDPDATARATASAQKRVNGDLVRNLAGAAQ